MLDELIENTHYYKDGQLIIFTELFHLIRGNCCDNDCKHCPYDKHYKKPMLKNSVVKKEFNELAKQVNSDYDKKNIIL